VVLVVVVHSVVFQSIGIGICRVKIETEKEIAVRDGGLRELRALESAVMGGGRLGLMGADSGFTQRP